MIFSGGCGMADLWDVSEPERASVLPPACPKLWRSPNPEPFLRVFANREYVMLEL